MQRSRLRKSQAVKKLRGRVVGIKDLAQWQKLLNKLGDKLLVAHFFASWSSPCKQMRSFLNDISSRPAYTHVVFAELDVDNDAIKGIAEAEDIAALPTVQFWKDGKCVDIANGGAPMVVLERIQRHAGARLETRSERPSWHKIAKLVGAGVGVLAAGLLGLRILRGRGDEETRVLRELEKISQRVKELRKVSPGRRRRRRRGQPRVEPLSAAEQADLFSRQQALTIKLQNLRQKGAGRTVDRLPNELADDEESDFSDDEL
ncbi:thioredoxin-like protein [Coccomyxa subellipsoidea C-169]|uniref:Thioredoxin-like protein n=1 Tax=Coccomyxa subellipsoidea (strain C-169) TaxID=574566 RepID=I0YYT8_COCSC|nr:thioredoxin-like protein [Coccomyxa subellipsoidea C-169]EIE23557.1 thioredoxin-like protein [Coccomyxa subellipsoidea C-169]|eukprot:XP_005648101.1 thioredoxin-like protein [Coccomyxa subellipsoidea C-169]